MAVNFEIAAIALSLGLILGASASSAGRAAEPEPL
jgi:hypothetical protein